MDTQPRNAIIDSGVLAAAVNSNDEQYEWAAGMLNAVTGRSITCEAAITEAVHLVKNSAPAVGRLQELLGRVEIIRLEENVREILDTVRHYTPRMDYADACAVTLQKETQNSFVITVDHNDFTIYRVPFASPAGAFYDKRKPHRRRD